MRTRLFPRHLIRSELGAAMVEFAIVLPVLILLFFGMVDFGRALFLYNNLTNAAREGARLGAVQFPPNAADITQRVKDRVQTFAGASAAVPTVNVTITNQDVTVAIANYAFVPITPIIAQNINMNVSAAFRWEGAASAP